MARPCRSDSPPTAFGLALRKARKAQKLTQQRVAAAIGVKQASVSGWERGPDLPRGDRLATISAAYKVGEARLRSLWMQQLGARAA